MGERMRITQHQVEEIIRLYTEGHHSQGGVARLVGVSQPSVSYYLRKNGIAIREHQPRKSHLAEECIADIVRMYSSGKKFAEIRKKHRISDITVRGILTRAGVPLKRERPAGRNDFAGYGEQLCWRCAKATGKCSWSRNLTPVPGWTATTVKRETYLQAADNYYITACPLYEKG